MKLGDYILYKLMVGRIWVLRLEDLLHMMMAWRQKLATLGDGQDIQDDGWETLTTQSDGWENLTTQSGSWTTLIIQSD